MRFAPILMMSLVLSMASWSSEVRETTASATLSRAALIGMQLSVQAGFREGKVSAQVAKCVQLLDDEVLRQSFNSAIEETWSRSDIEKIDDFLNTPLGKKFSKYSILNVYVYAKVDAPDEIPTFTDAEQTKLGAISQTSWGSKILLQREFERASARDKVKSGMLDALRSCGIGK
jgi:hypothetical protein